MELVKQVYTLGVQSFEAWFLIIGEVIWVRAIDVCKCLGYKNARAALINNVTNSEWKKTYNEIVGEYKDVISNDTLSTPSNWQGSSQFISEPALYQLLFGSRKKEALKYYEWVCKEVLPTIRKTGQFKMQEIENEVATKTELIEKQNMEIVTKNQLIEKQNNEIAIKNQVIEKQNEEIKQFAFGLLKANESLKDAFNKMYSIATDVIHKPSDIKKLHELCLLQVNSKEVMCLRRQIETMNKKIKTLQKKNPSAPNAINTWNLTKERLLETDPQMKTKHNRVYLDSVDINGVVSILDEVNLLENKISFM